MLLVSFIGWLVVRHPSPLSKAINLVAFMPLAIPGVISTLALFLMFVGTPLHGTLVLLTLAFLARYMAFGTRLMHSAVVQIHKELEEVSHTSGAGKFPNLLGASRCACSGPGVYKWLACGSWSTRRKISRWP